MDEVRNTKMIFLVEPIRLALRLVYLISTNQNQEKSIFFRTTRKRLERLAENKESIGQADNAKDTILDKIPITEAYIDCCRYELEKLGFTLIRANREYLIGVTEDLTKVRPIDDNHVEVYSLTENVLKAKVADFFESRQKKKTEEPNKKKPIADNKQLVLQDIWVKLVEHAKANLNQSDLPTLTYQELASQLTYKVHRNGLASFLFSIEEYCKEAGLPKLNYLVVKEGTGLPDGLKNTDSKAVEDFSKGLREIARYITDDLFTLSPMDIKYLHKARPKKSS